MGIVAVQDILLKLKLNPDLTKTQLAITYFSITQLLESFVQAMAETIGQLKKILWTNAIFVRFEFEMSFVGEYLFSTAPRSARRHIVMQ